MGNRPFRCVWSMVGRWLIYVPDPEERTLDEQLSLPDHMKAEAHKLGAADALYEALSEALGALNTVSGWRGPYALSGAEADRVSELARVALRKARGETA